MYNPVWMDKSKNETWLWPFAILGLIGAGMFALALLYLPFTLLKVLFGLIF